MGQYGMLGDRGFPVHIVIIRSGKWYSCFLIVFQGTIGQSGLPGPVGRIGRKVNLLVCFMN